MTELQNSGSPPPSSEAPPAGGADLARQALAAARLAAKNRPRQPAPKKRRPTMRREDSRDPNKVTTVLKQLVAAYGWETSAAGGTVMDRWPEIAPALAAGGNVVPVAFDADRKILSLRPSSPAFATQTRLTTKTLIERINTVMGGQVVEGLRVLPPGNRPIPGASTAPPPSSPPADDAEGPDMPRRTITREQASPGYRTALEQLHATRDRQPEPNDRHKELRERYKELRERYFAGAYTRGVEVEVEVDPEAEAAAERARRDAETHQAALRRARRERAERAQAVGKVFGTTA